MSKARRVAELPCPLLPDVLGFLRAREVFARARLVCRAWARARVRWPQLTEAALGAEWQHEPLFRARVANACVPAAVRAFDHVVLDEPKLLVVHLEPAAEPCVPDDAALPPWVAERFAAHEIAGSSGFEAWTCASLRALRLYNLDEHTALPTTLRVLHLTACWQVTDDLLAPALSATLEDLELQSIPHVTQASLRRAQQTSVNLRVLSVFHCRGFGAAPDSVQAMDRLTHLTWFQIWSSSEFTGSLSSLKNLRFLAVSGITFLPEFVAWAPAHVLLVGPSAPWPEPAGVRVLELHHVHVTCAWQATLAAMRSVVLVRCDLDADLSFAACSQLTWLSVEYCRSSAATWRSIPPTCELQLAAVERHIGDDIVDLRPVPNLRCLKLTDPAVATHGLPLRELRCLHLAGDCQVHAHADLLPRLSCITLPDMAAAHDVLGRFPHLQVRVDRQRTPCYDHSFTALASLCRHGTLIADKSWP